MCAVVGVVPLSASALLLLVLCELSAVEGDKGGDGLHGTLHPPLAIRRTGINLCTQSAPCESMPVSVVRGLVNVEVRFSLVGCMPGFSYELFAELPPQLTMQQGVCQGQSIVTVGQGALHNGFSAGALEPLSLKVGRDGGGECSEGGTSGRRAAVTAAAVPSCSSDSRRTRTRALFRIFLLRCLPSPQPQAPLTSMPRPCLYWIACQSM